jgi:hypothetical protein
MDAVTEHGQRHQDRMYECYSKSGQRQAIFVIRCILLAALDVT